MPTGAQHSPCPAPPPHPHPCGPQSDGVPSYLCRFAQRVPRSKTPSPSCSLFCVDNSPSSLKPPFKSSFSAARNMSLNLTPTAINCPGILGGWGPRRCAHLEHRPRPLQALLQGRRLPEFLPKWAQVCSRPPCLRGRVGVQAPRPKEEPSSVRKYTSPSREGLTLQGRGGQASWGGVMGRVQAF